MRLRTFLAFALVVLATNPVFGTEKIVYHHATGVIEARSLSDQPLRSTQTGNGIPLDVRVGEKVPLYIGDYNPVLFKYTWKGVTYAENADYAQALAFAKAAAPVTGSLGHTESTFSDTPAFTEGVKKLKSYINDMPVIAQMTLGDRNTINAAQTRVSGWNLGEIERAIDAHFEELRKLNPTTTVTVLVSPPAVTPGDNPFAGQNPPAPVPNAVTPPLLPQTKTITVVDAEQQKQIREALAEEADVRKALDTAKTFAKAVAQAGSDHFLENVAVGTKQDPTAHVHIDPVPEFEILAKDSQRAIGDVDLSLRPYYAAHFSMSPGLVYSFVKAPKFSTSKQADGTLVIAQNDSDYRGQNISAMLTITPRPWSDPTLGGGLQIGISPVKDQVGFFGGGQFRIADLIRLGAGYAYQQVPRLAKGLTVGQTISSDDDLKTEPHFKGGLYISIDIKLPNP